MDGPVPKRSEPNDEQLARFMAVRMFGAAGMSQAPMFQRLFKQMPVARENALRQHQEFQTELDAERSARVN